MGRRAYVARALTRPRMARDERPWRLCFRHRFRRSDTALSRLAHRRAGGAARPRCDVESCFRISPLQRRRRSFSRRGGARWWPA